MYQIDCRARCQPKITMYDIIAVFASLGVVIGNLQSHSDNQSCNGGNLPRRVVKKPVLSSRTIVQLWVAKVFVTAKIQSGIGLLTKRFTQIVLLRNEAGFLDNGRTRSYHV
jgi:hypothetical protein